MVHYFDTNFIQNDCLVGRVVASAIAGHEVSGSIAVLGKVLLGIFRSYENFSVMPRSLELCPVYGNRINPYCMEHIIQMVKVDVHCIAALRAVMCTYA
ncbi:hypothetical protein SFRURICE_021530 [Spodoptera frugiperda]|nr:hypothetical protein SFRURICE_021530 [Spodoptera frugiperda]